MSRIEFDVWLPGADLTDTPDAVLSTDDQLTDAAINIVTHGEGDAFIEIHADHPDTQYLQRRGTVRARDTVSGFGLFWWILEEANIKLTSKDEGKGKVIQWSGRGALTLFDRYKLGHAVFAPGQTHRGDIDIPDYWTWRDDPLGAVIVRFYEEARNHSAADFMPDVELDFTRTVDSAGNGWLNLNDYQVKIGTGGMTILADFLRAGHFLTIDRFTSPIRLQAYESITDFRTDRTSATFAIGKVRFEAGVNVATELPHKIAALRERSHNLTRRGDGDYQTFDGNGSGLPYMDFQDIPWTSDPTTVEAASDWNLFQRLKQSTLAVVQHKIGDGGTDGENGYMPGTHYWLGDLVTVHTGTGEYDLNEQTLEVAGIRLFLRGADWMAEAQLGASVINARGTPAPPVVGGGTTIIRSGVELCQATQIGENSFSDYQGGILDATEGVGSSPIYVNLGTTVTGDADGLLIVVCITDPTESGGGGIDGSCEWDYDGAAGGSSVALDNVYPQDSDGVEVWTLAAPTAGTSAGRVAVSFSNFLTHALFVAYVHSLDIADPIRTVEVNTGSGDTSSVTTADDADLVLNLAAQLANNMASFPTPSPVNVTAIDTDSHNTDFGQRDCVAAVGIGVGSGTWQWTFGNSHPWWSVGICLTGIAGDVVQGDGRAELVGTSVRAKRCDDTEHWVTNVAPDANDDELAGFRVNTLWLDTSSGVAYIATDVSAGAATWQIIGPGGAGATVLEGVYEHSTTLSIASGADSPVSFDTDVEDAGGMHNPASQNSRIVVQTAQADRPIRIKANISIPAVSTQWQGWIKKNGTTDQRRKVRALGGTGGVSTLQIDETFKPADHAAGDYYEIMVRQGSGSNQNIGSGTADARNIVQVTSG